MRPKTQSVPMVLVTTGFLLGAAGTQAQRVQGDLRILQFQSQVFENTRYLRVWLPEGYTNAENRTRRYPILYLNDGQNLFDAATAIASEEWRVDETMVRLLANGEIPPVIVVGIDNAGRRGRAREYLPYLDEFLYPPEPNPLGERYAEFLESEVIPFVERRFRVSEGARSRALGGSSYGALVALHVAISRPGLFSRLLLESPSLYVDDNHVLLEAAAANLDLDRVYLGVGTNELALEGCPENPGNAEAVDGVRQLSGILVDAGMRHDQVRLLIEPCAEHTEAAWARRLPAALRFLFAH